MECSLGECYYDLKDYSEAERHLKKSADNYKYAPACNRLGLMYSKELVSGNGAYYYKTAADQGYTWALYNLGFYRYEGGKGIEQNYRYAYYYLYLYCLLTESHESLYKASRDSAVSKMDAMEGKGLFNFAKLNSSEIADIKARAQREFESIKKANNW